MSIKNTEKFHKIITTKKDAGCKFYTECHIVNIETNQIYDCDDPIVSGLTKCDEDCCIPRYDTLVIKGSSQTIELSGECYNKFFIDNSLNQFDIKFTLEGNIQGSAEFWVRACTMKGKEFSCPVITGFTYEIDGNPDCVKPIDIDLISDC